MSEITPVMWAWRTVPRWSLDRDTQMGTEPSESEARTRATMALSNPMAIAALVFPVGLDGGEWVAARKAIIGVRSESGIKWYDQVTRRWSDQRTLRAVE